MPLAGPSFVPPPPSTSQSELQAALAAARAQTAEKRANGRWTKDAVKTPTPDPLKGMKIESELRTEIRENIARQRMIGSYVGKRHVMGLPVRGQNTQSNRKTARKLNRLERY